MNPPPSTSPASRPEGATVAAVTVLTSRGVRELRPADALRSYDFRQSGFLAPSELRRLRMRHEQFVRGLAGRLAMFLRGEFFLRLADLQIVAYQKLTENLPGPTHITLFKVEPLKGTGLLLIPPHLGLSLVDRLLGGSGRTTEPVRDLSEIEVALIDQVADLLITEWCDHWPEMRELRPSLIGHENHSRFLQTAAPDTAMLVLTLDAVSAEQLEPVQLALPYATIEPLVRLLCPAGLAEADSATARSASCKWNAAFAEVPLPVVAEWQGLKLSAGTITRLKSGDVLMLDPKCAGQVQLRLGDVPKYVGRAGMRGGRWAVELTGVAPTR
jgi:flagellar motor switch protein FliM